jgi:hypothetical protein
MEIWYRSLVVDLLVRSFVAFTSVGRFWSMRCNENTWIHLAPNEEGSSGKSLSAFTHSSRLMNNPPNSRGKGAKTALCFFVSSARPLGADSCATGSVSIGSCSRVMMK